MRVTYDVTAKDFRTWSGTVLMARFLNEAGAFESQRQMKRLLRTAIVRVAGALGNTPTVCRKSYVHPGLISAYEVGRFALEAEAEGETTGLRPEERAVLALPQALQTEPPPTSRTQAKRSDGRRTGAAASTKIS